MRSDIFFGSRCREASFLPFHLIWLYACNVWHSRCVRPVANFWRTFSMYECWNTLSTSASTGMLMKFYSFFLLVWLIICIDLCVHPCIHGQKPIVHGEYPFLDILSVDKVRIPWCLLVVCNHCTLKDWVIFPVPAIWLIVPTFSEIPSAWLPSTAPNQVIRGTAIPLSHLVSLRGLAFHAVPDWLKCQHFLVKPSEGIKLQNAMSSVTDT